MSTTDGSVAAGRGRRRHGPEVIELEVDRDEVVGTGGFLAIRRLRLRTRRADGTRSEPVTCDFLERPLGLDAVVVAVWARVDGAVEVLLREQLRPALWFGRRDHLPPVADARPGFLLTEVVAGIVEAGDVGEAGLRARAAREVAEEVGFDVADQDVVLLGAGSFPSPGAMAERFWLAAVEVDPAGQREPEGDGSPLEEGASSYWLELDAAIAAAVAGTLSDAKTELALRRLRDHLGYRGGA
jgi:ADP-ribose pyrophosphatase